MLAGALLEPASKRFVAMDIPSGSAARVALAHINNHIIRSKSLDEALAVPMGERGIGKHTISTTRFSPRCFRKLSPFHQLHCCCTSQQTGLEEKRLISARLSLAPSAL
jgi:hypothetical protein